MGIHCIFTQESSSRLFFSFLLKNSVFCNLQSRMNSFLGLCLAAMTIAAMAAMTIACGPDPKTARPPTRPPTRPPKIRKCYTDKFCLCGHCENDPGSPDPDVKDCFCEKWRPGARERDYESKCKCKFAGRD